MKNLSKLFWSRSAYGEAVSAKTVAAQGIPGSSRRSPGSQDRAGDLPRPGMPLRGSAPMIRRAGAAWCADPKRAVIEASARLVGCASRSRRGSPLESWFTCGPFRCSGSRGRARPPWLVGVRGSGLFSRARSDRCGGLEGAARLASALFCGGWGSGLCGSSGLAGRGEN